MPPLAGGCIRGNGPPFRAAAAPGFPRPGTRACVLKGRRDVQEAENKHKGLHWHSRLSVAPMMEWTDRHCRFLHRQLSRHALLYTEMVTAAALVHGDAVRLLAHHPDEHPLALQLGGSDPGMLARAVQVADPFGFDEINLNLGCPSDRVQSGAFGAVLMKSPSLVEECVSAMIGAAGAARITVKCRIGVDDQEPRDSLPLFVDMLRGAGVKTVIIHARKAWLKGLSPRENREVPPLDHALVLQIKRDFPDLDIVVNGGIGTLDKVGTFLAQGLDGAMVGRAAYHDPVSILGQADRRIFGAGADRDVHEVVMAMLPYIEAHLAAGGRLNQITRHMLGLFAGRPGARHWRRILSERAHLPGAGPELVVEALSRLEALQPPIAS